MSAARGKIAKVLAVMVTEHARGVLRLVFRSVTLMTHAPIEIVWVDFVL